MCPALAGITELLVLGTGAQIAMPGPEVRQTLQAKGIGLEVADTVRSAATTLIVNFAH